MSQSSSPWLAAPLMLALLAGPGTAWATPCTSPAQVGLVQQGQRPQGPLATQVDEQLAVEVESAGQTLCAGTSTTTLWLTWASPSVVTVEVRTPSTSRTRTVEQPADALPLALAVLTGELLREAQREPVVAQPANPAPSPRPAVHLDATADGTLSAQGTPFAGGSVGVRVGAGRVFGLLGGGALVSPARRSPSGTLDQWALTARLGGGVEVARGAVAALSVEAFLLGVLVRTTATPTLSDALGSATWTPALSARAGPSLRLGLAQGWGLRLAAGVGAWLRGLSVFDASAPAGGLGGVEGWLSIGGGVSW